MFPPTTGLPFDDMRALVARMPAADADAVARVRARDATLTKPAGSLGRLEEIVEWLAAWQGRAPPAVNRPLVAVFAGNHGVAAQGVSAYPAAVTRQMVDNFAAGGAAINQLARVAGAELRVMALSLDEPTADFTVTPAMTEAAFLDAVTAGYDDVSDAVDLVVLGEMGIGNTTAAAALAGALFGGGARFAGLGTGVDDDGLARKRTAIETALARHADVLDDPLRIAAALGGRELAAILGACLAARHKRIPVLIDGMVSTASVAPLQALRADALDHTLAGHMSAEAGHRLLLQELELKPLLDLGMRLGEGSGAAVAVSVLRAALACHTGMATFEEAHVSDKET